MKDNKRFARNLMGLAEIMGEEISELKLSFYAKALSQFTDDQIEQAINIAASSMERFPKPVQLIELIEGKAEDRAMIAWDTLLTTIQRHGSGQTVVFTDGRITKAVELMGGWWQVCLWTIDETRWRMQDFLKIYKSLGPCETKPLIGRVEQDNSARGFLEHIPNPQLIGPSQQRHQIEDRR